MRLCTVDECDREHKARGYCPVHYHRFRTHGDPGGTLFPARGKTGVEPCVVPDCTRDSYGLELCRLHYKRVLKFGSTGLPERTVKICTECDRPAWGHSLCKKHLDRLYRLGTVELPTDADRFWAKVNRNGDDECWPWQGSCHPKGHGYAVKEGRVVYAHRLSLEMHLGRSLIEGAMACHHCDNPPCVNPAHLYEGNSQSNVDDMIARGRAYWQRRKES